jgi:hypothetical protein
MNLSDLNDRQILVHLVHKVYGLEKADARIEKRLDNHLKHVWALAMALVVALLGVAGAAITTALCK